PPPPTPFPYTTLFRSSYRAHIEIAKRTGKALVIHDREAHDDVLRVLAEVGAPDVVVFHSFSGDAEMAKKCAEAGYFMSFSGPVRSEEHTSELQSRENL